MAVIGAAAGHRYYVGLTSAILQRYYVGIDYDGFIRYATYTGGLHVNNITLVAT